MPHPHVNSISNMNAAKLISIIEESKITYVRENLDIHLHASQIKLLKQVKKHEKPYHKGIRIRCYESAEKSDLFNLHLELYLKRYEKLAKKGLIEIDENPENGLPYDCILTEKGIKVLDEIDSLEMDWEKTVHINDDDLEKLRRIAIDSFQISYKHKKSQEFIF
jgi:predicted transcriptional regulator